MNINYTNSAKRPIIGITPLIDYARDSYWLVPGYMQGIIDAGAVPVMLPLCDNEDMINQAAEIFDGFLFTGGQDVSPSVYGEQPIPQCGECSPERDAMESALLRRVIELDKPLLGICRGIQLLNAVLGGTLYQDLPTQLSSPIEHHQKPPYDIPIHKVGIIKNTPLYDILGTDTLAVNSYHHQAVKDLSDSLLPMATAEDGLCESVFMPDKKFICAVQWHPEFSYRSDDSSRKIFEAFVNHAR